MRAIVARRAVAGLGVALTLTLSAAACGGGSVDKDKLVSKLKSDSTFKSLNDQQVKCVANVVVKYGKKSEINDYINGKASSEKIGGTSSGNNKKAEAAVEKCVK